jgi:hypothetical protein
MTHTPRTITTTILIVLTYVLSATSASDPILNDDSGEAETASPAQLVEPAVELNNTNIVDDTYTIEEQEWIDFAFTQFALAGLELPDVPITFPTEATACHGYGGVYLPTQQAVRICRPSKRTMIHELAHAWIEMTISDDDRQTFLEVRGLDLWVGGDQWDQRGAEQAAEIITWAVMDRNMSLRWIDTNADGTTTYSWRLAKIPDSNPDQLAAAYQQLTGQQPHTRIADDPRDHEPSSEILSPEARRTY